MACNFNKIIDRGESNSVKYDLRSAIFGKPDVIPMWVADMDFETPEFIRNAVIARANHPVYGYTFKPESYYQAIIQWLQQRHGWAVHPDWISFSPGVVPALNLAVLAVTQPNDKVIVQTPVYYPFTSAVKHHQRELLINQLIFSENKYTIDYDLLEQQAREASLLILCNPHNPVGRAWRREELEKVADICIRNKVIVLSDEIHNDLLLPGYTHQVFADLSSEAAQITITAHAPSKTFNLAGLSTSSVIISDDTLRKKFRHTLEGIHIELGNLFGITASIAAFTEGDAWLDALVTYLSENIRYATGIINAQLPWVNVVQTEATYMMWIDFSASGLSDEELKQHFIHKAGLGLSPGYEFGPGGQGFMRINVACPRSNLEKAFDQLVASFA
ncbi:MAG: PatB family C-S lyase [Bacteroidales bacterium]|nr:PatB family C-S lyase [Bacteroidales bacterium]